jgi:hypothetical protein
VEKRAEDNQHQQHDPREWEGLEGNFVQADASPLDGGLDRQA